MAEQLSPEKANKLMSRALELAAQAGKAGEVPIGALVYWEGNIIAEAHNEIEATADASAHAEVLALRRAAKHIEDWRLTQATLVVTLEPCTMCLGACKLFRVPEIVYGLSDPRLGAAESLFNLAQDKRLGPVPRVISGVLAEESQQLLQEFFKSKR